MIFSFLQFLAIHDPFQGDDVRITGFGLVQYFFTLITNYAAEYPLPIKICFCIVVGCIVTMILLYFMFLKDFFIRRRSTKKYDALAKRFHDSFLEILSNDTLTYTEMEGIVGCTRDEIRDNRPDYFAKLIAEVRMEVNEVVYLPNLQSLAEFTGVLNYFEVCLLKNRNVFDVLQILLMFQIMVSEGRLATYLNSHDESIRMMARMMYVICSPNEPYLYLMDDLNQPQSVIRPMLLHYMFGWRKEQNKLMPDFLLTADRLTNDETAAFMIREVAYWGSNDEKQRIPDYYLSERLALRSAAISVTAQLVDADAEDKLVKTYPDQPQEIRFEILNAMLSIRSGRHVDFLKKIIKESPSHSIRELAISCLYHHGTPGRLAFEHMREDANDAEKTLMNQIDSTSVLLQLQALR